MEATPEQWAVASDAIVDDPRVRRRQLLHRCGEAGRGAVHQEVVVVAHEAVGVDLDAVFLGELLQQRLARRPIAVVQKDRLPVETAIHHMVPTAVLIVSQWSCHDSAR